MVLIKFIKWGGGGNSLNNNDLRHLPDNSNGTNPYNIQASNGWRCEMNRKYLAFLVLTFLTIMGMNSYQLKAQHCDCPIDSSFPEMRHYPMSFSYDPGTDNYCTVVVHTILRKRTCLPLGPTIYQYEIIDMEVVGVCTLSDDEKMQIAIKAIASLNNQFNYLSYIKMPTCLYKSSTNPEIFESCDSRCCHIYFRSHWDSVAADHYLDDIYIDSSNTGCFSPNPACQHYCRSAILPERGYLEISGNMPPPCFSSCSSTTTFPQYHLDHTFPGSGIYINAGYTLGSHGTTPCFSFNYFQIRYGSMNIVDVLEKLVKMGLHQIYHTKGQPQYITLNLWKCWIQRYSPQQIYFPCINTGCCEITFEILSNGTQARVHTRSTPSEECQGTCIDVCGIFDNNPFMLPKSSLEFDELNLGDNIRINPNPNTGFFELEYWSSISEVHTIQVVDVLGNIIFSTRHESQEGKNNLNIDMTRTAVGIYYLHIQTKGLTTHKLKFIKN